MRPSVRLHAVPMPSPRASAPVGEGRMAPETAAARGRRWPMDFRSRAQALGQATARACVQRAKEVPGGQDGPLAAGLLGPAPLGRAGAAESHWGIGPTRASEDPP